MRLLVSVACILMIAATAFAQGPGGYIGLYSDEAGTCCIMYEALNVLNPVYVVHSGIAGAIGAQFRVQNNWGNAIVGPVTYHTPYIGNIFVGVSMLYNNNACQPLPLLLATMSFIPTSSTPTNEQLLQVLPDNSAGKFEIEVVDCSQVIQVGGGGQLYIDINYVPLGCDGCFSVPTEKTTWGKVKSLYN